MNQGEWMELLLVLIGAALIAIPMIVTAMNMPKEIP